MLDAVVECLVERKPTAFSKVFKQHCGMSPRMYKEEKSELVINKEKYEYKGSYL